MTDPKRWRDPDGKGPEGAGELLSAGRRSQPMPSAARARSSARIARLAAMPTGASLALLWTKALVAGASVGLATVVVAYKVVAPAAHDQPRVERSPEPRIVAKAEKRNPPAKAAIAEVAGDDAVLDEKTPAESVGQASTARKTPASVSPSVPAARPLGSAPGDELTREAAVLERARGLLATRPSGALEQIEVHAREFPSGQLVAERELIAIDALRRLRRASDARTRGEALIHRFPGSIYEARVQRILADIP